MTGQKTATPWTPTPDEQGEHPELAHLAVLAHHLVLLTAVLRRTHANGKQPEVLTQQARGMVQVLRVLELQIDAYRQLIAVPVPPAKPSRRSR